MLLGGAGDLIEFIKGLVEALFLDGRGHSTFRGRTVDIIHKEAQLAVGVIRHFLSALCLLKRAFKVKIGPLTKKIGGVVEVDASVKIYGGIIGENENIRQSGDRHICLSVVSKEVNAVLGEIEDGNAFGYLAARFFLGIFASKFF